jgi:hypothetical protein
MGCSFAGCQGGVEARGLCQSHYMQQRRGNALTPVRRAAPPVDRFWRYVLVVGDGCWVWKGDLDRDGYGRLAVDGRMTRAHRFSFALHSGEPVPGGTCVCHRCDNRVCVNPAHLFLGSRAENLADMDSKGRRRFKLTESVMEDVRALRSRGVSMAKIAKGVGVHWASIQRRLAKESRGPT